MDMCDLDLFYTCSLKKTQVANLEQSLFGRDSKLVSKGHKEIQITFGET